VIESVGAASGGTSGEPTWNRYCAAGPVSVPALSVVSVGTTVNTSPSAVKTHDVGTCARAVAGITSATSSLVSTYRLMGSPKAPDLNENTSPGGPRASDRPLSRRT
jgi:hypothetical protein